VNILRLRYVLFADHWALGHSYLPLFTTALNKTLQPASINLGSGITLTNSNGYGLTLSDAATFAGALPPADRG